MDCGYGDVRKLSQLLREGQESDSSDDDLPPSGLGRLGPGHIGPKPKVTVNRTSDDADQEEEKGDKDSSPIWDVKEVPDTEVCDDAADPRQAPEWTIIYSQKVTPEDVYLQMGGRTPATASCEDQILRVSLPGEQYSSVHLDVTSLRVDVRSPTYRLGLPLPHAVDPNASHASWEADTCTLVVTLRLQREFDYVNF